MTFSDNVRFIIPLTSANQVVPRFETELGKLKANGGTALYTALIHAIDTLRSNSNTDRQQIIVLISDGGDTVSTSDTLEDVINKIQAGQSNSMPVFVIPVAYGSSADLASLERVATASQTKVLAATPDTINSVLYDVLAEITWLQ